MTEINTKLFNTYFKDDNSLSNLYSWMIESTDEFTIDDQNYLSNCDILSDFYHQANSNCNVLDTLTNLQVLKKTFQSSGGYTYDLIDYADSLHSLPSINSNLESKIDDTKISENKLQTIFNIYQYYDYLLDELNSPDEIEAFNVDTQPTNYYNIFTRGIVNPKPSDLIYPETSLDHKTALVNAKNNDKLNLELIFVCRGIMLTLLYRYIYNIYLSYYKVCDGLTSPNNCETKPTSDIDTLLSEINTLAENQILLLSDVSQSFFILETTFDGSQLNIDNTASETNNIIDTLHPDKHIIYNQTIKQYVEIRTSIPKIGNTHYNIEPNYVSPLPSNGHKCLIFTKNNKFAAAQYSDNLNKLNNNNKLLTDNKNEYTKSINNHKIIKDGFGSVDVIYYITIAIVVITLIAIIAANSDKSFNTRVFILLLLVVLTYVIIFSYLEISKQFAEHFTTPTEFTQQKARANGKIQRMLTTIYSVASYYGKTDLYNILNSNVSKDLKDIIITNKKLNSSTGRNNASANSEWHKLFQRTLFIHTTFLILIVILTYLWLSTAIPDLSMYLFIITVLVCMILIFNYFRSLHRVVRTRYKHRYWTKMDV